MIGMKFSLFVNQNIFKDLLNLPVDRVDPEDQLGSRSF